MAANRNRRSTETEAPVEEQVVPEGESTPTEETQVSPNKERDTIVKKAYARATGVLRERYKEEHTELVRQYAAEAGVDWKPRASKEEKELALLRELQERYADKV